MAGQNVITAVSISPQVLLSQQIGATDVALYTVPASTSAKIAQGSICNVTGTTAPPTLTLGTTATSGGTFAAGTFYWKVTAKSAAGETLASNEVSATLAVNGTQVLSWTAVPNAASYCVYRGTTAGNESVLVTTVTAATYTDTGTTGSTGYALPSTNLFGFAVNVSLSIVKTGGTVGDGTHRIINNYSLAANDSLPLNDLLGGAMLGPGDIIAGFASSAAAVDLVVTGTVHA